MHIDFDLDICQIGTGNPTLSAKDRMLYNTEVENTRTAKNKHFQCPLACIINLQLLDSVVVVAGVLAP